INAVAFQLGCLILLSLCRAGLAPTLALRPGTQTATDDPRLGNGTRGHGHTRALRLLHVAYLQIRRRPVAGAATSRMCELRSNPRMLRSRNSNCCYTTIGGPKLCACGAAAVGRLQCGERGYSVTNEVT